MDLIFEVIDKNDKLIHLSKERWLHISKEHPEVTSYIIRINEILRNPTKIVSHIYNDDIKYFYRYIKEREQKSKYLLIIVKYLNGSGFIITTYFTRIIK